MAAISGLRLSRSSRSVSELANEATLSSSANGRKRLSCSSILPTMRGRTSSRQLNNSCLTWFSTISRRSSMMKISSSPTANSRTPLRLQRPGHADLVKPEPDLGGDLGRDAKFAQCLPDILIALAGGHDAEPRVRRIHGDAIDLVGAGEGDRGKTLVVLQTPVLIVAIVGPAQVESARRHLEIGRNDEGLHLVGKVDLRRGLHRLGDHLHADPASAVARHRDPEQPHLDHLVDAGGIEIGHQRGDKGVVRLMRHGGGFCAVIVAGQAQHAAVLRRARGIAMAEHVAAAVDARPLAVPDADHAIVPGARRQIELLRAPDRGGRQIFVHAGLELDVVLIEMLARGEQLLVVAAERRTPVSRDKTRGIETGGAVAADLGHRQAHQRLYSGQEDMAGALGVFLIETDRTLVDSHYTLLSRKQRPVSPWPPRSYFS